MPKQSDIFKVTLKMDKVDILIIGAGVIGLAVAKEAVEAGESLIVLERNASFGCETSSRNSEVVHGGMHYPAGSLKAGMCVEGRRLLYEMCRRERIPFRRAEKLIVAANKQEMLSLHKIFMQGKTNGVEGLKVLSCREMNKIEPHISGSAALLSPQTGIIDSHCLMEYFLEKARDAGAVVVYNSEVSAIRRLNYGYEVTVKNNNELCGLRSSVVINCAGLDSDKAAQMAGIDIKKSAYQLYYCKGEYFRVNARKAGFINRLVYPLPELTGAGLGIHATLDLAGGLRLGPDSEYLNGRNKDYSISDSKKDAFYFSIKRLLPFLEKDDLSQDTSGIRPKLQGPGENFRDFVIKEESEKGLPGLINLIGIESPGLTASPAIAKYVKGLIRNCLSN